MDSTENTYTYPGITASDTLPCSSGAVAAAAADADHSGALQATSSVVSVTQATLLGSAYTFAVCYAETDGSDSDATWKDTGIRVTTPKLQGLKYSTPVRTFTSTYRATNVLPVQLYTLVTYVGDLDNYNWISLVSSSLNSNNPCVQGSIAAAVASTTSSGPQQPFIDTKTIELEQEPLMSESTTYALCYAEDSGETTDTTWRDSYIRLKLSLLTNVAAHLVTHTTDAQIAQVGSDPSWSSNEVTELTLSYNGELGNNKWISLIDDTLASDLPCTSASEAAATADSTHSGALQAGASDKLVVLSTLPMSTAVTYAVCYATVDGSTTDSWADSGIRLTISKITSVEYGPASTSYPVRTMTSANTAAATHTLPQVANAAVITYVGDLDAAKWVSLVDVSLTGVLKTWDTSGSNPVATYGIKRHYNPCMSGDVAAAAADAQHSGAVQAGSGTKEITFPQSTLLGESFTFALCYAETDGSTSDSTWRDSYIRVKISKIQSITAHGITHLTDGGIPSNNALNITYEGSLDVSRWLSLVDHTLNSYFPCESSLVAASEKEGTLSLSKQASGAHQAGSSDKVVTIDTTSFSASLILAVCYTDVLGSTSATWYDSGIRVATPQLTSITYGYTHTTPLRTSTSTLLATDTFPRITGAILHYHGELATDKWVSMIDETLNSGIPCVSASVTAAAADTQHSGAVASASSSTSVTIPQTTLLAAATSFALCYAETSGSNTDDSWRDSYIRLTVSEVSALQSDYLGRFEPLRVSHTTTGTVGRSSTQGLVYIGSLLNNKWISLVDETLNSNFPCNSGSVAAASLDSSHSGALQGGSSDKVVAAGMSDVCVNELSL